MAGRKPSTSSHRLKPMEGLNLTPFIDMITCLMFFLLMFAGIIPVVMIDAPLPKIASTAEEIKQAKDDKNKLEVMVYINPNGLVVKATGFGDRSFAKGADGKYPIADLHKHLITVHARKADAKELTLMPADDTTYETMIEVMDAARELVQGDAGYQAVPPDVLQKPEGQQFNRLFPDISIGGV